MAELEEYYHFLDNRLSITSKAYTASHYLYTYTVESPKVWLWL